MAQPTISAIASNDSLAILRGAIELSTTSTMTYGSNGVATVNPLTVQKKSLFKKIFKK